MLMAVWLLFAVACGAFLIVALVHAHQMYQLRRQLRKSEQKCKDANLKIASMEREIKRQDDSMHLIQDHMVEGLIVLDDSDKIQMANKTAVALLHIEPSGWETKSIFILTENSDFLAAMRESKRTGREHIKKILKIEESYIRLHLHRIEIEGIYSMLCLFVDVTYSVRAEKMRQEFTANVSHELKTPLTTIKGFGEMFAGGMIRGEENIERYGARIERESERLLFLINDIIRLSQIEEQTEMLDSPVDMYAVTQGALLDLEGVITEREVTVNVTGECRIAHSNESYMRELMVNLIENAVKYNNIGGQVNVTLERVGDEGRIIVADNGIGIPKQAQARIFERFYRVDKSRSKESGGTGLGLSIVKHIVECHGGEITLVSELGVGTTITITLPA